MKLYEILAVTNESTMVDIVDADTGEVLIDSREADSIVALFEDTFTAFEVPFSYSEDWYYAEVMDINVWKDTLTICIEVEHEDDE